MPKRYAIILAKSPQEAITYARSIGLQLGQYRYAAKASSLRGLRAAEIHILPGFAKRPDRFAINAAIRYVRGERIYVDAPEAVKPDRRLSLERAHEVAFRYLAIKEASSGETTGETEQSQDPAPAEKVESPAADRRKRKSAPQARKPKAAEPAAPEDFF